MQLNWNETMKFWNYIYRNEMLTIGFEMMAEGKNYMGERINTNKHING